MAEVTEPAKGTSSFSFLLVETLIRRIRERNGEDCFVVVSYSPVGYETTPWAVAVYRLRRRYVWRHEHLQGALMAAYRLDDPEGGWDRVDSPDQH